MKAYFFTAGATDKQPGFAKLLQLSQKKDSLRSSVLFNLFIVGNSRRFIVEMSSHNFKRLASLNRTLAVLMVQTEPSGAGTEGSSTLLQA